MKETKILESIVVSFNNVEQPDNPLLLVGRGEGKGPLTVINAFVGKEAEELYLKLVGAEWKESPIDNQDINKKLDEKHES